MQSPLTWYWVACCLSSIIVRMAHAVAHLQADIPESQRRNLRGLIEFAYRSTDPIHAQDLEWVFFFLGRGIKFRHCSCSRPWALCNQLAHCTGAVEVVMGPQIRPLESSYILVKKMHAGLGLNTESFKCLLCRTLLSGNYSLNSHHYPMLILWYYIMVIRWGYPY